MKKNQRLLVTGSSGLVGSEVVQLFCEAGWSVTGIDNNLRAEFFGPEGDTRWNTQRLLARFANFSHQPIDLRDRKGMSSLLREIRPDVVVHAAAQPSHDLAARRVFDDFDVNATGTLNLLEAARLACPEAPFVHMSTNKVYGDAPNEIPLQELPTRYDYANSAHFEGIAEGFRIDQSKHSLFGASKLAADILVQEYGRYFNMPTCVLRAGCITGPNHSGVQLHGFLSYLIRSNLERRTYRIFGYKGKQVRDSLHSFDLVQFIFLFIQNPQAAAVYNVGGGRENSISILEAFTLAEEVSGIKMISEYVDQPRAGDHICYISNLAKARADYPSWKLAKNLRTTFEEIHRSWISREKDPA